MLSELFEKLPEVGDLDKPKLVFFFDEAHLLFNDAPKPLLDAVEQVVRLIRSKGVGVYFVTQNPLDVPETVLGQLGNRVQHALRAFTPRDQKAVRAAAETFRQNPGFDTGEGDHRARASARRWSRCWRPRACPSIVERTLIAPPHGAGRAAHARRAARRSIAASPLRGKYDQAVDRESAYEMLAKRKDLPTEAPAAGQRPRSGGLGGILGSILGRLAVDGGTGAAQPARQGRPPHVRALASTERRREDRQVCNSLGAPCRTVGAQVGRRRS